MSAPLPRESGPAMDRWRSYMQNVPREEWPASVDGMRQPPIAVWRSRRFLAQVHAEINGAQRLTICRTTRGSDGRWHAAITWDELQQVKAECGFPDRWAVEIFPAESDLVNVANMRHLWILPEAPAYAWQRVPPTPGGREP